MTQSALYHNLDVVEIAAGAGFTQAALAQVALATVRAALGTSKPRRPRRPRNPTLASALKAAAKAGKSVKGAEVYKDRIVLQFGEPAPAEPDNPWPLDEFRTKEIKQ